MAVNASGNLYIADSNNLRVRRVDAAGTITSVAGNGVIGYSGDGGPATSAQFGTTWGLALDSAGNLYIPDSTFSVIRKVATSGTITTVAGIGDYGYSGDGGPAVNAKLNVPHSVAVDVSGNLFIADTSNQRIRKVGVTGIITTVAGNGTTGYSGDGSLATSAQFSFPVGVAVDAAGNLYVADEANSRIRKVTASGFIATVAGNGGFDDLGDGGPATSAAFRYPYSVSVDASGNVAVADEASSSVRLLTPTGTQPVLTIQSFHLGGFTAGSTELYDLTVANTAAAGPTTGTVTVAEILPTGLTLASMSGSGWTCAASAAPTCTRSDALSGGASYPAITVTVTVSATAPSQVTNQASVSGGGGSVAGTEDFTIIAQHLAVAYTVGDVYPYASDSASNFGDAALDIRDLIQELFAVNSIPGYRPSACSDRFDAMDLYPPDTGTARGGDGSLDIRDLILELFRVNNLDPARPVRASRGGVCTSSGTAGATEMDAARGGVGLAPARRLASSGTLALGAAERMADGTVRASVYLEAAEDLSRIAVTFGLGDQRSRLRFAAAPDLQPSLVQDGQLGVVAAAWLEGVSVPAGERLLLGYVTGPAGALESVQVYGISASGLDDNREVRLSGNIK